MVAGVSLQYTAASIFVATGATSFICLGLSFYAATTKTDFTGMGPYLCSACLGLIFFGIFTMMCSMCFTPPPWLTTLWNVLGAILASFFFVYDLQLILGGDNSRNQYQIDDYV